MVGFVHYSHAFMDRLDPVNYEYHDNQKLYKNNPVKVKFGYSQLSTGSAVAVEQATGTTITSIGKTGVTVVCKGAGAEKLGDNGKVVTMVYKSNLGVAATATVTIAADFHDTEKAFVPAVTDFYCMVSLTISASSANDLTVAVAGGTPLFGTITAAATSATQAQLLGVGAVYGRYHTDAAGYDGAVQYMEYSTPWGEVKWAHCTTDLADSKTEVRFFEGTYSYETGIVTATTTTVKDFYRRRWIYTTVTPAGGHTWLLTDADCGNVDGSGTDVYAMIEEAYYYSVHSMYYAPKGKQATFQRLIVECRTDATNYITLAITMTLKGSLTATTQNITLGLENYIVWAPQLALQPDTTVTMTIVDGAAATTPDIYYECIEVDDR
jgi:hypothetical protein